MSTSMVARPSSAAAGAVSSDDCLASTIVGRTNRRGSPKQTARASGQLFDCLAAAVEAGGDAHRPEALLSEVIAEAPKWGEPYEQRYLHRAAAARAQLAEATPADAGPSCLPASTFDSISGRLKGALSDLGEFRTLVGDGGTTGSLLAAEQSQLEQEIAGLADKRCQCGGRDAQLEMCADSPEVAAAKAEMAAAEAAAAKSAEAEQAESAQGEGSDADKGPHAFARLHAKLPNDNKSRVLIYSGAGVGFVGLVLGVVSLPFLARGSKLAEQQIGNTVQDPGLEEDGLRADALAMGFGISGAALVLGGAAMIVTPLLLDRRGTRRTTAKLQQRQWTAYPTSLTRKGFGLGLSGRF